MTDQEEWRPVEITPAHRFPVEVSSLGRVRTLPKRGPHILAGCKPSPNDTNSYLRVTLGGRKYPVHKLVARAFLTPVAGKTRVLFRNGDTSDVRADNLYYGDAKDIQTRIDANGRRHQSHLSRSGGGAVLRSLRERGHSIGVLAKAFNRTRYSVLCHVRAQ